MKSAQTGLLFLERIPRAIPVLASAMMLVIAFAVRYTPDDAFISFRYALNIARGYGPVFNLGQHVEGYTSPLWVFTLAVLKTLGLSIESMALVLSIGAASLTVLMLPYLSRRLGYNLWGLDALVVAANTSFVVWAGSSMEMTAFALFLVLASIVLLSEERPWLAGTLFAILALIRPEGLIFGGLALVFAFLGIGKRQPDAIKNWSVLALTFVTPVVVHLLWRLSYYHYPLPNTFYAKVGTDLAQLWRGGKYLGEAAWVYLIPLSLPLLIGLTTARDRKRRFVAMGLLVYLGYVVAVGGDGMASFRLITPIIPYIALFAAVGWVDVGQKLSHFTRASVYPILAVVAVLLILALEFMPILWTEVRQSVRDDGETIALWINDNYPTDLPLAVYAAGAISYYAPDFHIVDMFGLNKEDIAHLQVQSMGGGAWAGHEKFSAPLTLKENPGIFVFQPTLGTEPITMADGWRATPLGHLTRQFTDKIDFWQSYSTQAAPMPNGKYFNFVVVNPNPYKRR